MAPTPPPLPGFLSALAPVLDDWGYLAVAVLVFVEDFGVPVPGETVMTAAAVYAGAGRLNVVAVACIAFSAAVLGDNIGYAIGRYGGHPLVVRYGRYVFLTEERLHKAQAFFARHGGKVVAVARFIEGLRQINGIAAGTSGMPWPRFLAFNALGAALWVGVWVVLGYFAGQHVDTLFPAIERSELYLLVAIGVVATVLIIRRVRRRKDSRRNSGRG